MEFQAVYAVRNRHVPRSCSRYGASGVVGWPFFSGLFFNVIDLKLVQSVAGLKGCNEPSRSFSPAGPCFRWNQRITVFGQNLWILTARRAIGHGQWVSASGLADDFDPI